MNTNMPQKTNETGPFRDWGRSMQERGQVNNSGQGVDHVTYNDYNQTGAFGGFDSSFGASPFSPGPRHGYKYRRFGGWDGQDGPGFAGPRFGGWGGHRGRHGHRDQSFDSAVPNPGQLQDVPGGNTSGGEGPAQCPEQFVHKRHHHGFHGKGGDHCRGGTNIFHGKGGKYGLRGFFPPGVRGSGGSHGFHGKGGEHGRGPHHCGGRPGYRRDGKPKDHADCGASAFDISGLVAALPAHTVGKDLGAYTEQAQVQDQRSQSATVVGEEGSTFAPPIDIFSTPSAVVLHIAIPGAKKEDVGINWDSDKNELNVAGIIYRNGDEEFLKTMNRKERKVGLFERVVKFPLDGEKEEVDGEDISAKLEEGILIVVVPKVEKEWMEVTKIDVQ